MGIREILGKTTGGTPATWNFVSKYLRDSYIKNPGEIARRMAAKKRDAFYLGDGDKYIEELIDAAFKDPETRRLRKAMIPWAKHNNVIRRVSSELATVYNEPARRWLSTDDQTYEEFTDLVDMDGMMRRLDEMLVYHEDVWVQYRVRKDDLSPTIDLVSPANFWAVADPTDTTSLAAIIVDQTPSGKVRTTDPCYRVWCKDETFQLDQECRFIQSSLDPWPLGMLPGVLASAHPPGAKQTLLARCPAADLTAAHEAIWFINVLLVKETKSANKQTYHTGDTSQAVMGQSADTEYDVVLPEGVSTQAIDRGMDLNQFIETANHILETAAANHGLPPSVLHQRDAASGAEIHLRRIPIRELRKKRIPIMRRIERQIAVVQSQINKTDLPAYVFNPVGWGIDFGEVQQPLTEAEQDAVFEKRRQLGLTDTLEELRRRNPDLTDEAVRAELELHITNETLRVELMRNLMAMSGSAGQNTPDPNTDPNTNNGGSAPPAQDSTI